MSRCTDNPRAGRTGCGATYTGGMAHSVARVPWSTHPDGRAHITFGTDKASLVCWRGDTMRDPSTITTKDGRNVFAQDERSVWRYAPPDQPREWNR
jgi:hypothetical protein